MRRDVIVAISLRCRGHAKQVASPYCRQVQVGERNGAARKQQLIWADLARQAVQRTTAVVGAIVTGAALRVVGRP